MLFCTPPLDAADRRVVDGLDSLWEEARTALLRCAPWCRRAVGRRLIAAAIAGGNRLEGFRTASCGSDVEDLLDGGHLAGLAQRDKDGTEAAYRMTGYARAVSADHDFAYSKGQLNALHWMLRGRQRPTEAGRWRLGPADVTDPADPYLTVYRPPEPARLPALMEELAAWLNEGDLETPAAVRGAMAHLHLAMIRPWACGNGRMSRFLQTLVTARSRQLDPELHSLEEWLGRPGNMWEYEKALADVGGPAYAPERDAHAWLRFQLFACHQQAQTVRHRIRVADECWLGLNELAVLRGISTGLTGMLHEVALAGKVHSVRYQEGQKVSLRQAQRDLQELVDAGLLTAVGRTRGRYFVPGAHYPPEVLQAARRSAPRLTDPYRV